MAIVPGFNELSNCRRALRDSPFCTAELRLPARAHGYCEGSQHCRRGRYRVSPNPTSVFFLQVNSKTRSSLALPLELFVSKA
eukprot:COSAG04_NODE_25902_length_302_cov_0.605911_1_plen_81_part_01